MEKRTPHYPLRLIRSLIHAGQIHSTRTALTSAASLGFDFDDMVGITVALDTADFYKSMTTYHNHRVWQDVYRPNTAVGPIYLKLTVNQDALIISFKEL